MEKKLRIQLFDPETSGLISDRLLSQDTEVSTGPKLQHLGPLRVEFTLLNKADIEKAIVYLNKLTGALPLESKEKKKKVLDLSDENFREDLLNIVKGLDDQDLIIRNLREKGFTFITTDYAQALELGINFKDIHKEKYQWMVNLLKRSKDPKNDRYDPMIAFGIQMYNGRNEKVLVYMDLEFKESFKSIIPENTKVSFQKFDMMVFAKFMTEEERDKFRKEHRYYQDNPEKPLSKFYVRWAPHVEIPESQKLKDRQILKEEK